MCLGNQFFSLGNVLCQQVNIHLSVSSNIFFNLHIDIHTYGYIYVKCDMYYILYIHKNVFACMFSVLYVNIISLPIEAYKQRPILNSLVSPLEYFSLDRTWSWQKACEQ